MVIIELLATNTVAEMTKFLIDQIVKFSKRKGKDKEVEVLKNELETYREKTKIMGKELTKFKEITKKLETKLGSRYLSENTYVNWSFDVLKPKISAFKIDIWTEKGDFQSTRDILVMHRNKTYNIGDKLNIYFQSEKDCYLTLINYGTSGKLTVLLPNTYSYGNFIKGGEMYAIPGQDYPFNYILNGPPGNERIKAIGTTRKINLMNLTYNKGEVFSTSSAAARDISVVAKNIESVPPYEWAEAMCEIEVI